ncbi:hypothetical protein JRO89_XS03G0178000 [Xanthoceras sorbifolium]|uniref:SANT domain-containing protein n=1 Tax=Xanthoceras sorbifolium TaxID=99658 RepID=A0ABQ8IAD8_9ROSI|nr:hypothetical protein JRO89_XS03G0178000 [Xanthoceras sorbifolium]
MDVVQENNCGDILQDAFNEKLISPECLDACDEFRDPELLPRVGDQYQAEIPPLMAEYDCLWHSNSPTGAKFSCDIPNEVLVGLPISIMWIKEEVEDNKLEPHEGLVDSTDASKCITETMLFSEGHDLKPEVEPLDITLDRGINLGESSNLCMQQEMMVEIHQKHRGKGCRLVPGSAGDTWSDIDEASFLLGLYIFGKNLIQVKKFVESKRMGDVLSFYYGKFYRSDKYRRWSECQKMRSRKCIYGQRIFTGLRQQELLSRLLLHVSEECKKSLLEDTKAHGDGKMSLEEYVLGLRAKVGLNALVEAVGIGKGKQDLTGMAMEPPRSNQVVSIRPEIPTGKACSALTPLEIINFLTGGYRLSKARSNDLFWEAVWPRLLARGWHSEQPNNLGCAAGSKNSLVFLIPGVKKFSRRKLVKGNHYFDSISDVLSKVAEDPALLEFEIVTDKEDGNKEENGWTNETELDREDFSDQQQHCYLKPRTPNHGMDVMKFTVVDTSLANSGRLKVKELRSLPVELRNVSTSRSHSEDSEEETSESTDESDSSDTICFDGDGHHGYKPSMVNFHRDISLDGNASNRSFSISCSDLTNAPAVEISTQKNNKCDKKPRKTVKAQLSKRRKPERNTNIHLAPVTKRCRRLNACNRSETTSSQGNASVGARVKEDGGRCFAGNPDASEKISLQIEISQEKLSSTNSSSKGSPVVSGEGTLGSTCSGVEQPHEEPPPRREIDLNLPIPPDAESDELFMKERMEYDQTSRQPDDSNVQKAYEPMATSEQQPTVNARRHSTRNRPLTTKALEALAFDFLSTKLKRKFKDVCPEEKTSPSCRA